MYAKHMKYVRTQDSAEIYTPTAGLWSGERKKELKGIVSRDFGALQIILMDRICVPDVPLEVYSFLNLHLHIVF